MKKTLTYVTAFFLVLLIISTAVLIVINWRGFYSINLSILKIPSETGVSAERLIRYYQQLMAYMQPWYHGALKIDGVPISNGALIHFAEVKTIFVSFYWLFTVSLIVVIIGGRSLLKRRAIRFIDLAIKMMLFIPLILGSLMMIDFNQVFILFHQIVFRNDLWIFDPSIDPIIEYLPQNYFMNCAFLIISIILILVLLLHFLQKALKKHLFDVTID